MRKKISNVEKIKNFYTGEKCELIPKIIKALKRLLWIYRHSDDKAIEIWNRKPCPLCEATIAYRCRESCPWPIITGSLCIPLNSIIKNGDKKYRMTQIRTWKKAYEQAWKEMRKERS